MNNENLYNFIYFIIDFINEFFLYKKVDNG